MTTGAHEPDEQFVYSPAPTMPELYVDLDLMLLCAPDGPRRWAALVVGTREVLNRFDHLSNPSVFCPGPTTVIDSLAACARRFEELHVPALASWLRAEVIDVLSAHQRLQEICLDQVRCVSDAQAIDVIAEVSTQLQGAAAHMAVRRFAPFPERSGSATSYEIKLVALATLAAEMKRNPLRKQLDGAGGAAGSAEFNPLVGALTDLELVTHRRLYRVLYQLAEHVGVELDDDDLFDRPEIVEGQPL